MCHSTQTPETYARFNLSLDRDACMARAAVWWEWCGRPLREPVATVCVYVCERGREKWCERLCERACVCDPCKIYDSAPTLLGFLSSICINQLYTRCLEDDLRCDSPARKSGVEE